MTRASATVALLITLGVAAALVRAQSRALVAPEAAAIYQRLLPRKPLPEPHTGAK